MTRSMRAWRMSCGDLRAVSRGDERTARAGSSAAPRYLGCRHQVARCLRRLSWSAAAVLLLLAFTPAISIGRVASKQPARPSSKRLTRPTTTRAIGISDDTADRRDQTRRTERSPRAAFAGATLLALGSGYASDGSAAVRSLQRRLAHTGYSPGPIDGLYGPLTERAVAYFQAAHGLVVDGIAGTITLGALRGRFHPLLPGAGFEVPGGSPAVRSLQRRLASAGFVPGPIDGLYGPLTLGSVARFERAYRLPADGVATARMQEAVIASSWTELEPHGGRYRPATPLSGGGRAGTPKRFAPVGEAEPLVRPSR